MLREERVVVANGPTLDATTDVDRNVPLILPCGGPDQTPAAAQTLDRFCSQVGVFTHRRTRVPFLGVAGDGGMVVLLELASAGDDARGTLLRVCRPKTLGYGTGLGWKDVWLADGATLRGLSLCAAQLTAVAVASSPQYASTSEIGARAYRAREILQELIAASRAASVNDKYMGPGYETRLGRMARLLEEHRGPGLDEKEPYRLAMTLPKWRRARGDDLFKELAHLMAGLRAVVVADGDVEVPVVCRSDVFSLARKGIVVEKEDGDVLAEARRKKLIVRERGGEELAEVQDLIALEESGEKLVGSDLTPHVSISRVVTPYVRNPLPAYLFVLTRFQRDLIEACGNAEMRQALRDITAGPP